MSKKQTLQQSAESLFPVSLAGHGIQNSVFSVTQLKRTRVYCSAMHTLAHDSSDSETSEDPITACDAWTELKKED